MISFEKNTIIAEQGHFSGFEGLIVAAISERLPLVLNSAKKTISVGFENASGQHDDVVVRGQTISPEISLERLSVRLGIFLPFLVEIEEIAIPPSSFATFGYPYRPLADFFTRNFFAAALRKRVRFESGHGDSQERSRDLQRCYVWTLKTQFNDAILEEPHPEERLLRACHFELDLGDSPFFSRAALEVREQHTKYEKPLQEAPNLGRLLRLRTQVMAAL